MRGGYGTSDHGSLADRRARPPVAEPAPVPDPGAAHRLPSPARHCFVEGEPSLLVEWRRSSGGWEGRVITLVLVEAVGWVTQERWLPAAAITPA